VLFLDELPEFSRHVLELLRQPLEEGRIQVNRARYRLSFPADFILVAAMNPCPCGYLTHPKKACQCGPGDIRRYMSRISGPLLDRFDMQLEVVPVSFKELSGKMKGMGSRDMRDLVREAREIQQKRFSMENRVRTNGQMGPALRRRHCAPDRAGYALLRHATEKLGLSARAYDRILKVARTIADLDASEGIRPEHVAEAIAYRNLDRDSGPP
jgi:magnesium chelatase family protein